MFGPPQATKKQIRYIGVPDFMKTVTLKKEPLHKRSGIFNHYVRSSATQGLSYMVALFSSFSSLWTDGRFYNASKHENCFLRRMDRPSRNSVIRRFENGNVSWLILKEKEKQNHTKYIHIAI